MSPKYRSPIPRFRCLLKLANFEPVIQFVLLSLIAGALFLHSSSALAVEINDLLEATRTVDKRARYLPYDELLIGDEYMFIRELYLQNRKFLQNKKPVEVVFEEF